MKKQTRKRAFILISSIILSMSMIAAIMPQGTIKADEEIPVSATPYEDMKKEHEHDEDCGYVEAKEGIPCDHVHDENCGEMDEMGNYPDCQHNHEDCSYQDFIEGQPCNVEENKIPNTENSVQLVQVNDVVAEEVEITFDDDIENTMTNVIAKAMEGKSENEIKAITTIKVTGNASAITDKNWKALLSLYIKDSGYPNLNTLDLSSMYSLKKIASSTGTVIYPTQLTTVSLPDTLTEIGDFTFMDCVNLNISQLPSKLEIIGNGAFSGCSSLSLIELPDTITSIRGNAFNYCTKLALTKLPSKLTKIEESTFRSCSNLNIKTLPEGIQYIKNEAFYHSGITEIVIPSKVTGIGNGAFKSCSNLKKITFEGSTAPTLYEEVFNDIAHNGEIKYPYDGTGYDDLIKELANKSWNIDKVATITYNDKDDMNKLISVLQGKDFTTLRVTGDATEITDENWKALLKLYIKDSGYPNLNTLDLSSMYSLKKIASSTGTVIYPTQLTTVCLPDTLTEIGELTFDNCVNLNISQLPSKLEIIGNGAFYKCSSLTLTELPDTITSIERNAFTYCTNLNIKSLPEGIEYIEEWTFSNSGITEIVIPSKVTGIGDGAFMGCSNLKKIIFKGSASPTVVTGEFASFKDLPTNGSIYYPEDGQGYEWIATMLPTWKINPKETIPSGSSFSHSHYYSKQWKNNEVNHWHECSCGKQKDLEAHEYSEWIIIDEEHRERECLICGYIQKETFTHRQLTDALTGVQLSGLMSEHAVLIVSESPSHAVGLCSACDEIRSFMSEGKLVKAYEISLEGDYKGELTVSFPIDPKYNGETFMLIHYLEDDKDEQPITVIDGKAEGKVESFSPFALIRMNESITQQVSLNQGESITIQPVSMNGTWTYDEKLLSITQNGDSYTVTAIKEGTATAVYTTDTTQTILDINVQISDVPNTNDSMRIYMIIAIVSLLGFVLIKMYQKRID